MRANTNQIKRPAQAVRNIMPMVLAAHSTGSKTPTNLAPAAKIAPKPMIERMVKSIIIPALYATFLKKQYPTVYSV